MPRNRTPFLFLLVLSLAGNAFGSDGKGAFTAKGYLNFNFRFTGSALSTNAYSALRLSGSLRIANPSNTVALVYQSQHWFDFQRTDQAVLEEPFKNRNILHSLYLETRDVAVKGLKVRLGRFFPELDYSSMPLIDGASLGWERGGFSLTAALGRAVDVWNGGEDGKPLHLGIGSRYRSGRFTLAASFSRGEFAGIKTSELAGGVSADIGGNFWLDAYGGYDFEQKTLARAGMGLSWRADRGSLSVMASSWRNPFDQLVLLEKSKDLPYWGTGSPPAPADFRDVRVSGSMRFKHIGVRGSFGLMGGVRSGWLANAYFQILRFLGFQWSFGGQTMRSDFIEFNSLDVELLKQMGSFTLQVETQMRLYRWVPRPSGFRNSDTYSEVSLDYQAQRHLFLHAAAGLFFRNLGDESIKPRLELGMIWRL